MQFFAQEELPLLQLADLVLVSSDQRVVGRGEDAAQQGFDLLLDFRDLLLARANDLCSLFSPLVPGIAEHGCCELERGVLWLKLFDEFADLILDLVPSDGLAIVVAGLGLTEVVGVELRASLAP
ncbi:MAG: hypothetical protein AAF441_24900 [Pseudomonadota bacterium]